MNELTAQEKRVSTTAQTQMIVGRVAQEVQAAMVIAKQFPRDIFEAEHRIKIACQRKNLAEQAEYTYPRGGTKVNGPSIRLAEAIAQNWGNIDAGIIELENKDGQSQMMAYAWDLETNTRITKIFTVEHKRDTKKGSYALTDSRDIYELTANQGSRRLRACILSVVPGDVVDLAVEECRKTLENSNTEPFEDRIKKMLEVFNKKFKVTKTMIEDYVGYSVNSFDEGDLLKMKGVYKSIDDGMASREDYFQLKKKADDEATNILGGEDGINE